MEAPEYRYRLYSTPGVSAGQEVADFIAKHSDGVIIFDYAGEVENLPDQESPIQKRPVEATYGKRPGEGFYVVLSGADLAEPVFWCEGFTAVSRYGPTIGQVRGPDLTVYAYLTLVALVGHKLYAPYGPDFSVESVQAMRASDWAEAIKSAQLADPLQEVLGAEKTSVDRGLGRAVDMVLKAIAEEASDVAFETDATPDIAQRLGPETKGGLSAYDIYVSYSTKDRERVVPLVSALEDMGWLVWWDQKMLPGMNWEEVIQEALENTPCVMVVWSVNSASSEWVRWEARTARERSKIIPVKIDDIELPRGFRQIQTSDLTDWRPGTPSPDFEQLIASIERTVKRSKPRVEPPSIDMPPPPSTPIGNKLPGATSEYGTPTDVLGYRAYAEALGDLITHPDTQTPLTIAICGPWGSGKSTLMQYVKERVEQRTTERNEEYVSVDFNAWKYSKSDAIWAPFYSEVLKGIEKTLSFRSSLWFRLYVKLKTEPVKFALWAALGLIGLVAIGWLVYMAAVQEALSAGGDEYELKQMVTVVEGGREGDSAATFYVKEPKAKQVSPFSVEYWSIEEIAGTLTSLVGVVAALFQIFNSVSTKVLGKVKKGGKELAPAAQDNIVNYVNNVQQWVKDSRDGKGPQRFVVYVDDVDRVEPNKIMQMMEAIKLFLDTPGFVFVLAMDARVVRQAIGEHYSFMGTSLGDREWWGHHYLEKIIQIPFYLPKINRAGLNSLKQKLLGGFVAVPSPPEPEPPTEPELEEPKDTTGKREKAARVTEPGRIKTEPPSPSPEPPETSAGTVEPPPVDESMDMTLTPEEDRALDELFRDGLELAPRLMVRLKNVYLLARHVYLRSVPDKQAPPPTFTKWIALSVKYPFEIKELIEVCTAGGWPDSWQKVVDVLAVEHDGKTWEELNKDHLAALAKLLPIHVPTPKAVEQFTTVTNLFNLVLD